MILDLNGEIFYWKSSPKKNGGHINFGTVLNKSGINFLFRSKENINYPRYRILIFLIGFSTIILSEMTIRFIKVDFLENLKFVLIPLVLIVSLYSNYLVKFKEIKALR